MKWIFVPAGLFVAILVVVGINFAHYERSIPSRPQAEASAQRYGDALLGGIPFSAVCQRPTAATYYRCSIAWTQSDGSRVIHSADCRKDTCRATKGSQ